MTTTISPLSANGYLRFTLPDRDPSVFDHVLRFNLIWRESQGSDSLVYQRYDAGQNKGVDGDLDRDNRRAVFEQKAEARFLRVLVAWNWAEGTGQLWQVDSFLHFCLSFPVDAFPVYNSQLIYLTYGILGLVGSGSQPFWFQYLPLSATIFKGWHSQAAFHSTFRHALVNFPKHFTSGESPLPFWSAFHFVKWTREVYMDRPSTPRFWPRERVCFICTLQGKARQVYLYSTFHTQW